MIYLYSTTFSEKKKYKISYDVFTIFTIRALHSSQPKRIAGERILENEQFDTIFPPL